MQAFMPGASPPDVNTPIFFISFITLYILGSTNIRFL